MAEDRRWEEYKLLQAKVDGIGAFKFQIRGWAVTLLVAFLGGGMAAKIPAEIASVAGFFVVILFYFLDSNQQVWSKAYIQRLRRLETLLVQDSHESRINRSPGIVLATGWAVRSPLRRLVLNNEARIFYLLLVVLIVGFTVSSAYWENVADEPIKIQIVPPPELSSPGGIHD